MAINEKLMGELKEMVIAVLGESALASFEQKLGEVTEDAKKAISDLVERTSELEALLSEKKVELEALELEKSGLVGSLEAKVVELEAVKADRDVLAGKVAAVEASLEEVRLDGVASVRMGELAGLGIVRKSEEAAKVQSAKVRVMSDEEFVLYRDELVVLKSEFSAPVSTEMASLASEYGNVTPPADVSDEAALSVLPNLAGGGQSRKQFLEEIEKDFGNFLASGRGSEAEEGNS